MREMLGNPFAPPSCEMKSIKDHWLPSSGGELRVRRYHPKSLSAGLQPALLFFHGGGHVLGTLDGYDTFAQQLARLGNCVVLSVEYRLAPETKSAGIYQDGFDVYVWLLNSGEELGIDTERIAIGGDSAGGNISIAVMLQCKQHKITHRIIRCRYILVSIIKWVTPQSKNLRKAIFSPRLISSGFEASFLNLKSALVTLWFHRFLPTLLAFLPA